MILSDGIERLNLCAFANCESIKNITIPASVTSIGLRLFNQSSNLATIVVANGNTVYDSRDNCNAIIETATNKLIAGCNNSTIPQGVTALEQQCFSHCESLTTVIIPNSVTNIGAYAFYDCVGLTEITIPGSVTTVGESAKGNRAGTFPRGSVLSSEHYTNQGAVIEGKR